MREADAIDSARVMHTPQGVAIQGDGEMPNATAIHEYEQPAK
ncbi:hypothetical protein [Streptomyces platensis]|nr:hypothetical protein [Streptomyces platensis]